MVKLYTVWFAVLALFGTQSIGDEYIKKPGYCMMRDECGINSLRGKNVNCFYNGPAKIMNDSESLNLIQELCPYLYNGSSTTTCCTVNQLKSLKENLKLPIQLLSRCPSCYANFRAIFCQMACNSNQSMYLNPLKIDITTKGNSSYPSLPGKNNTQFISNLEYSVSNDFAYGMYNSCSSVVFPSTGKPAMPSMMCGSSDSCDAHKLMEYLGSYSNGQTPFQITMKFFDSYGMEYQTTACNESNSITGEGSCSCSDCPVKCPTPSYLPKDVPWIKNIDGMYYVMAIAYFGAITILNLIIYYVAIYSTSRSQYDNNVSEFINDLGNTNDKEYSGSRLLKNKVSVGQANCLDKLRIKVDNFLYKVFRMIATFCAYNPIKTLVLGFIIVLVCGLGFIKIKVTTDPVELWSSPTSDARINKNYFDMHFGPFYRTEQLIITAPNSNYSIYTDSNGIDWEFGPVLQQNILHEILSLQEEIFDIKALYKNKSITLQDICFKPLEGFNDLCSTMSVVNYFQNKHENIDKTDDFGFADYHDHLISCLKSPQSIDDGIDDINLSCLGDYGGPVYPYVALGGYPTNEYWKAQAAIVTVPVVNYYNDTEKVELAMTWEKEFVSFMKLYQNRPNTNLSVAFSSERSIEDEINRESSADVSTIIFSYLLMFAYVAISLGRFRGCNFNRVLIELQLTVGLSGVIIVFFSVIMSLGIFSYCNVPITLIIAEVVPFLALAVGVDNIFIIVQKYHRDERRSGETLEDQLGRIVGEVAPSIFLSALSETVAFFLGGLSTMPAVKTFSMFAGLAVFCDFLLQITCFVSILSLDARRKEKGKYDCACCLPTGEVQVEEASKDGYLYTIFKSYVAPSVLNKYVRPIVLYIFIGAACFSVANLHNVQIGLDQSLSMPRDSYVLTYFSYMNKYLSTGAPVYFVVKDNQRYELEDQANQICGGSGCNNNSLVATINIESYRSNDSTIAYPASSWIDDYYDWLLPLSGCCRFNQSSLGDKKFCNASIESESCTSCRNFVEVRENLRPNASEFIDYLPWFLNDNPGINCSKGGHAAYNSAVTIISNKTSARVGATYFMTYHTITRTSGDFISCLKQANRISKEISQNTSSQVFPYSVFYPFYEQYLTIVEDTIFNLVVSLAAIFGVTFVLLGLDFVSALFVCLTISMITVDMFGIMYLWDIPLNAVSLVNLVMTVGISVEFCAHIVSGFISSCSNTRIQRAKDALALQGSSVMSGITLTKFVGILILGLSKSQIFTVFYFRMYLSVVLLGAAHGLIFLPVVLSFFGPQKRSKYNLEITYHSLNEDMEQNSSVS